MKISLIFDEEKSGRGPATVVRRVHETASVNFDGRTEA